MPAPSMGREQARDGSARRTLPARLRGLLARMLPESYREHRRQVQKTRRFLREIEQHPERAMVAWTRPDSPELFYVFQGLGMALMMDPLAVLRETGLIHANLLMLKDHYRFFYHAGVNAQIPDLDAVRARLEACRSAMPHVRQTFCLGTSSGAYAALLFGHYLQVDRVYAFGPPTHIDFRLLQRRSLRRDVWRFPAAHRDLALLLASHNGRTRYDVFYCEGHARDRAYAEHIRGCPGVELHPQPGDTHLVVQAMHKSGRLRVLLGRDP